MAGALTLSTIAKRMRAVNILPKSLATVETLGFVNVICSAGVWNRYRRVARDSPALIIRGILERSEEGVINILADAFEDLRTGLSHRSRDFR